MRVFPGLDLKAAVDRVSFAGEGNRMRHGRVVAFLGIVIDLHPEGARGPARRVITCRAGRDRRDKLHFPVDCHGRLLAGFVDRYDNFGR